MKCFVIIGYGKKTSYAKGKPRELDLDQTFKYLIKPVFDRLGIECYRAIDKNITGSIDKLMLQEIKDVDIALADLSTLNANVMWELGVRHALKPHHTIMICEKEQMGNIPFDINSFVIHQYVHSEEGIPITEVESFPERLTKIVEAILNQNPPTIDSPVYTFLNQGAEDSTIHSIRNVKNSLLPSKSFASIMEEAEKAKDGKDYSKGLELFTEAKKYASINMTLKDNIPLIVCRQALCTYKLEEPNKLEAFVKAKVILDELNPLFSQDLEVLGLSGAVNKRLFELTSDTNYLDIAIKFYEKGFQLKKDYYNGINTAFMLYKKASITKKDNGDWEDIKLKADYIRNEVLSICLELEKAVGFNESNDAIWVLNTIAEAYNYKNDSFKMKVYEDRVVEIADRTKNKFAVTSYIDQKNKISEIFKNI